MIGLAPRHAVIDAGGATGRAMSPAATAAVCARSGVVVSGCRADRPQRPITGRSGPVAAPGRVSASESLDSGSTGSRISGATQRE